PPGGHDQRGDSLPAGKWTPRGGQESAQIRNTGRGHSDPSSTASAAEQGDTDPCRADVDAGNDGCQVHFDSHVSTGCHYASGAACQGVTARLFTTHPLVARRVLDTGPAVMGKALAAWLLIAGSVASPVSSP